MSAPKPGLAALLLLTGLAGSAPAQGVVAGSVVPNGFAGGYPGAAVGPGYYGVATGYGSFGLPGGYPGYAGNPLSGYGPGVGFNTYHGGPPHSGGPIRSIAPQTRNDLGGLMNTIQRQTGPTNSYGAGSSFGVARRRRVR